MTTVETLIDELDAAALELLVAVEGEHLPPAVLTAIGLDLRRSIDALSGHVDALTATARRKKLPAARVYGRDRARGAARAARESDERD